MDTNTILLNAIVKETAAKVFESLSDEAKREILTNAVERILKEIKIEWSIREILEKEAVKFAEEHIKTPEFQEKIKALEKRVRELEEENRCLKAMLDCYIAVLEVVGITANDANIVGKHLKEMGVKHEEI